MKKTILLLSLVLTTFSSFSLAEGDVDEGKELSVSCAGCHGADGNSVMSSFPKLAGQGEGYLYKQLLDFKSGARQDGAMAGVVAALSEQDMMNLAAYFAAQTITENTAKADAELIAIARKIYLGGKKDTDTTACIACHGPKGRGIPSAKFPVIAAQHADYTATQLVAFRQFALNFQTGESKPERTNDYEGMMRGVAKGLTTLEIDALAQYIAGLH